ncbi:heme-binding protein [Mycobacterium sp. MYCO198283]|uniref:heme-binding protein n=1 Tax=Mycobacterium sp. MYCO198283 TaxID=2883505 RepID=UPI001E2D6F07|nr:heme-binding protein [Mycobacterium sp. MYCO198283]MCG5434413.1 heme-binding protein [Mycobacterium sp. MYCO198283]
MNSSGISMRRTMAGVLAGGVMAGAAVATLAAPTAAAAPAPCTAAGVTGTISSVSGSASQYLAAHPGADRVLTDAANKPYNEAEASVRAYFEANPNEYYDLKNITRPLVDLQNQCGTNITPAQAVQAFEAFQRG